MAPLLTRIGAGNFGGIGIGRKRGGIRLGPPLQTYSVFYSPGTLNISSYTYIDQIDFLSISSGGGGGNGADGSPGSPANGGSGGTNGRVSYQNSTYGKFVTEISPQSININTTPAGSFSPILSGPAPSISVPAPVGSIYPEYTFTPAGPTGPTAGANGNGGSPSGGPGGLGLGGIVVTAPPTAGGPIPSVSGTPGLPGSPNGNNSGGGGGAGGTGYGAGGGGGGGGANWFGNGSGGGAGGAGSPGIVIAKITYRNII